MLRLKKHSHIRIFVSGMALGMTIYANSDKIWAWVCSLVPYERFMIYNALVGIWARITN